MQQYQELNELLKKRQARIMNVFRDKFRADIFRLQNQINQDKEEKP